MNKFRMLYWKEEDFWVGYIEEYPDYQTQGQTLDELKENIIDIYNDIHTGLIPNVKKALIMEIGV
ncbi:MAG: type II toxin-antitoxin system HicB family antitoxin [Spirochaetales bacterium]|nr:type II toxin-antitoxin system HicB family antitoxin [Spirochaetales bacterium]